MQATTIRAIGGRIIKAVVGIAVVVAPLGYYLAAEKCAGAEKFAEETYDYEYYRVAAAVAHAVEE